MFKGLFRTLFTVLGLVIGFGLTELTIYLLRSGVLGTDTIALSTFQEVAADVVFAIIFGLIFFKLTPFITKQSEKASKNIESNLASIPTNNLIAATIGLILGLIIAYFITQIYESSLHMPVVVIVLNLITYIALGSVGMMIGSKRSKDLFSSILAARKTTSSKSKSKDSRPAPKILDTSVIIDGRIADIMKTGFIEGDIVIPEFVLVELRHIADSSYSLKRNRGRRGLDILNKIQSEYGIEIYNTTAEKSLDEIPEVDVKLLKLAQIMGGKVVTNDFNLNKVATIKGVEVLNINALANTLKPVVLPGEDMEVFLIKEGKEHGQAVAYLDDGTMIVVEEGYRHIGKSTTVVVTSVLQTSAGRMIFAKPKKRQDR